MFRLARRAYQVVFFSLFLTLVVLTSASLIRSFPVQWFLGFDPLVALTTALSTHSLYPHLAWAIPLVLLTLVFGRFFCGWICPMGVLHHVIGWAARKKKIPERAKANSPRESQKVKYLVLVTMLAMAALGSVQIGLLDPIASTWRALSTSVLPAASNSAFGVYQGERHFQFGTLVTLVFFGALALNFIYPRFYCRVLCPLGALLGLLSRLSLFRLSRRSELCTDCNACAADCQGAAEPTGTIKADECMLCLNCTDACPRGAITYSFLPGVAAPQKKMDPERRRWIGAGLAGVVAVPLLRASDGTDPRPHPNRIRPPGAVDEPGFLARCIKCGACMKVCPTGGLQPSLIEAGLEGLWSPVLVPRIGYCEQNCTLCGTVCPTGAIGKLTVLQKLGAPPENELVRLGSAYFDHGRCLPWANDTDCIVCEEVCPTSPKAIFFKVETVTTRDGAKKTLKRPQVDLDKCWGCGICETRCPVFDRAAVRVSSVGESRSPVNRIVLTGGKI
ncbi:MAG: 4Fe-4S binding protein [Myxococcaceae bacterium]